MLSHAALVAQFHQSSPNCGASIAGGKSVRHLLHSDHHAHIFAALGSENEAKLLAVTKAFNNGLGPHLHAPLLLSMLIL
jgi:hypothetical protein